jgi:putative protease
MKNFEILAPVGAKEQLHAAVRCGANAVYLGAGNFNARRNAENFTNDDLSEAIKYCHLRGVRCM